MTRRKPKFKVGQFVLVRERDMDIREIRQVLLNPIRYWTKKQDGAAFIAMESALRAQTKREAGR